MASLLQIGGQARAHEAESDESELHFLFPPVIAGMSSHHPGLIVARYIFNRGVVEALAVFGRGEIWIRAHATVRELAAEILGIGERAVGRDPGFHRQALDG